MKLFAFVPRILGSTKYSHLLVLCGFYAVSALGIVTRSSAQTAQPQPTAASTPVAAPSASPSPAPATTPSPAPTATPYPSPTSAPTATPDNSPTPVPSPTATPVAGGSPSLTIVPGLPSAADMDAYNAARTPQVSITLTAATTPGGGTASASAASSRAASPLRPVVRGGVGSLITLQPAAASRAKAFGTAAANPAATAQPVATITLTYSNGVAGQHVWVQALRKGGTLSATDGAGHVYDGSQGFFLTLDANGTATFSYQAPNVSGTYQVLTRYTNVKTTLPFVVPDPAP